MCIRDRVKTRYPEVGELGFVDVVQAAELPQFIARIVLDPPTPLAPGQTYEVTPPGNRPFYCLTKFWYGDGGPSVPLGYDICASYGSDAAKICLLYTSEVKIAHVWTLANGKATRFQQHVDTAKERYLIA